MKVRASENKIEQVILNNDDITKSHNLAKVPISSYNLKFYRHSDYKFD